MGIKRRLKKTSETKYERAKERVKEIKGWYNHLIIYIMINSLLQLMYSGYIDGIHLYVGDSIFGRLIGPVIWGVGLIIHGLWVFRSHYLRRLFKNWETRKIEEFMQDDAESFNRHH